MQNQIPADKNHVGEMSAGQHSTYDELPRAGDTEPAKDDADQGAQFDHLARLQAEAANWRKRAEREQQEFKDYALADAIKSLLPILDSLDRAVHTPAPSLQEYRAGIDLIRRQFEDALTRLGVKQIPATGVAFDPRRHQAIEVVETSSVADNHVLEELQRGYALKDRLLRPTLVRVARNESQNAQADAA